MDNILKLLYGHFYRMPENAQEERRVEANHQLLRQRLSSRNRKLVLRIMDDKDARPGGTAEQVVMISSACL